MDASPLYIGVSGHQQLGGEEIQHFVAQEFRALLLSYQNQGRQVVLYSSLAKGADQLFVNVALALGIAIEIVLPCTEYETIFATGVDRDEYRRLLKACPIHHHLPAHACSEDAYLAAGQWIVDRCHLLVVAWNGLPPLGRGGTGDVVSYARFVGCPYLHLHTRALIATMYQGVLPPEERRHALAPKHAFVTEKQPIYQGAVLTVDRCRIQMPGEKELVRDVITWPDSVLVLPVGQKNMVLLIEEYNFGAGTWQLTLPGGKVETHLLEQTDEQAQKELRQETGYRASQVEKLLSMHSHPGYVSHRVHAFVARDLEWDPLPGEAHEEICVQAYTLEEALRETTQAYRFDPEAALVLWLYAQSTKTHSLLGT